MPTIILPMYAVTPNLLAPGGWMVWHDYQDTGWLAGWNRVPEFLNELGQELAIAVIPHTALAVYHAAESDWLKGDSSAMIVRDAVTFSFV